MHLPDNETNGRQAALERHRHEEHAKCFVCGPRNSLGLQLEFTVCRDGSVEAFFACPNVLSGYEGTLHGGVICTLLDSAMANVLFSRDLAGVTGELKVRFLHPVETSKPVTVRAWLVEDRGMLIDLAAEITQGHRLAARATAKFVSM
ncbi:MAG: PaaI family thioesterase [Myxococcota bacterium]|jgi:uncharacterized protein (TIGR00369 family)|nr:PaaI family thioesterase [Myxococcota bacterium]